jgi:hypothetical protein
LELPDSEAPLEVRVPEDPVDNLVPQASRAPLGLLVLQVSRDLRAELDHREVVDSLDQWEIEEHREPMDSRASREVQEPRVSLAHQGRLVIGEIGVNRVLPDLWVLPDSMGLQVSKVLVDKMEMQGSRVRLVKEAPQEQMEETVRLEELDFLDLKDSQVSKVSWEA